MTSLGFQRSQSAPQYPETSTVSPGWTFAGKWFWLALVLLLAALYMGRELKRGWIPWDEGTLAESAERVLHGELPHRDYHEGYTGGLDYLNAGAFRLFGTNLASMRYVFFVFFLAWVCAFYYAASRFCAPIVASAITLIAVAWGPPNYAAGMPSWYNLYFATFGLAALLRYIEVQTGPWLLVSGLCGGVSFLFKLPGLFFMNGVLLFLVFREQTQPSNKIADRHSLPGYRFLVIASIVLYEFIVFNTLLGLRSTIAYLYFWVPELVIGGAIIWHEFYFARHRTWRFHFLFNELLVFGAGFAIPIALFLLPYFFSGTVAVVMRDIFFVSQQLLQQTGIKPSLLWFLEGSAVNLLLLGVFFLTRSKRGETSKTSILGTTVLLLIPTALILARQSKFVYQSAWSTFWMLGPLVILLGTGLLVRGSLSNRLNSTQRQLLLATLSVTGACNLIQFPFSAAIYFCYVAPLALLSATAAVSCMEKPPRLALGAMSCFCFLYAVLECTPGFIYELGTRYAPDMQTVRLSLPRAGGLRVTAATAHEYEQLVGIIRQHARGQYIFAKPDSPQVYFLSGFRDPGDIFFDFYEDPVGRTERALKAIHSHNINLVVLNNHPPFAGAISAELRGSLEEEFPNRADAGDFEVRWKP